MADRDVGVATPGVRQRLAERTIGIPPFGGQATEAFHGAILEFAACDDPQSVNPSLYTGHWDNLRMLAGPNCHWAMGRVVPWWCGRLAAALPRAPSPGHGQRR